MSAVQQHLVEGGVQASEPNTPPSIPETSATLALDAPVRATPPADEVAAGDSEKHQTSEDAGNTGEHPQDQTGVEVDPAPCGEAWFDAPEQPQEISDGQSIEQSLTSDEAQPSAHDNDEAPSVSASHRLDTINELGEESQVLPKVGASDREPASSRQVSDTSTATSAPSEVFDKEDPTDANVDDGASDTSVEEDEWKEPLSEQRFQYRGETGQLHQYPEPMRRDWYKPSLFTLGLLAQEKAIADGTYEPPAWERPDFEGFWRRKYFFYGPMADPRTLAGILGRDELPALRRGTMATAKVMLKGTMPVLIEDCEGYSAEGYFYEVQSEEEGERIKASIPEGLEKIGALVVDEDGAEQCMLTWAWEGSQEGLIEGAFDLEAWKEAQTHR